MSIKLRKDAGTGQDELIRQFEIKNALQKQAGIIFTLKLINKNITALSAQFQLNFLGKLPETQN
ncbi:MAG: hypothetical protein P8X90_34090, partial [Desulfobacterales bacterium]